MISELLNITKHVIVVGDFNINLLSTSKCSNDLKDILSDYSMVQHIATPTCITDTSVTLTDHAITTVNLNVNCYQTLDLSDH